MYQIFNFFIISQESVRVMLIYMETGLQMHKKTPKAPFSGQAFGAIFLEYLSQLSQGQRERCSTGHCRIQINGFVIRMLIIIFYS